MTAELGAFGVCLARRRGPFSPCGRRCRPKAAGAAPFSPCGRRCHDEVVTVEGALAPPLNFSRRRPLVSLV